jgi:hypothetical protein
VTDLPARSRAWIRSEAAPLARFFTFTVQVVAEAAPTAQFVTVAFDQVEPPSQETSAETLARPHCGHARGHPELTGKWNMEL